MSVNLKNPLLAIGSLLVIIGSALWIYFHEFKAAKHSVALHQRIGQVLAEQTVNVIGKRGHVVTLSIDSKDWPELKTQIDAYKAALKKLGEFELRQYEMDTKDQPKYGVGSGLSGRRYVRTVNKNTNADLFVSFIGAPKLKKDEIAELAKKPKLIVESRSGDHVPDLFESQLLNVAVVSRFEFPAPGPEKPKTPQQWFEKRYQVLTAETASQLPKPSNAE
jgi:hypothetical protein